MVDIRINYLNFGLLMNAHQKIDNNMDHSYRYDKLFTLVGTSRRIISVSSQLAASMPDTRKAIDLSDFKIALIGQVYDYSVENHLLTVTTSDNAKFHVYLNGSFALDEHKNTYLDLMDKEIQLNNC